MRNQVDRIDGWNSYDPIFSRLIVEIRPTLIIEVGSWMGASAIHMLGLAPSARIACVDTWLGSLEHWLAAEIPLDERGYPRLFEQFKKNVAGAGMEERVRTFPMPSTQAAKLMAETHHPKADLIYIDGSHDYGDVVRDLRAFWPLLRDGGVMFGDDWIEHPTVMAAVIDASPYGTMLTNEGNFWIMRKP